MFRSFKIPREGGGEEDTCTRMVTYREMVFIKMRGQFNGKFLELIHLMLRILH